MNRLPSPQLQGYPTLPSLNVRPCLPSFPNKTRIVHLGILLSKLFRISTPKYVCCNCMQVNVSPPDLIPLKDNPGILALNIPTTFAIKLLSHFVILIQYYTIYQQPRIIEIRIQRIKHKTKSFFFHS